MRYIYLVPFDIPGLYAHHHSQYSRAQTVSSGELGIYYGVIWRLAYCNDDLNPEVPHYDTSESSQALMTVTIESNETWCVKKVKTTPPSDPGRRSFLVYAGSRGEYTAPCCCLDSQPRLVACIISNEFGQQIVAIRNDAEDTPLEANLMDLEEKRACINLTSLS